MCPVDKHQNIYAIWISPLIPAIKKMIHECIESDVPKELKATGSQFRLPRPLESQVPDCDLLRVKLAALLETALGFPFPPDVRTTVRVSL